jgi:hypothetical protein
MAREDLKGLLRRTEIIEFTEDFIRKKKEEIRRFIKKENFRTGRIHLKELNFDLNLLPNQFYRLETVDNIFDREQEIIDDYSQRDVQITHTSYSRINGLCIPLNNLNLDGRCRANIVLIKEGLSEPTRTYVTGHENGHFVYNMGLKNEFYRVYGVPPYIQEQITDTEDFAMFCGNIAMANAGYLLSKIKSVSPIPSMLEKEEKARKLAMEVLPEEFYFGLFGNNAGKSR